MNEVRDLLNQLVDLQLLRSRNFCGTDENADPGWEMGMPWGHLQDQRLREFMGAAIETDVIARRQILVASADVDAVGGFRIRFSEGAILAAFPASCRQMEWMLKGTDGSCAIWINGALNYHGSRD